MRSAEILMKEFLGMASSELKCEYNMLVELYRDMEEPYILSMYYDDRRSIAGVFNQLQHSATVLYKLDILNSGQLDSLISHVRTEYFFYYNKFCDFIVRRHPDFV